MVCAQAAAAIQRARSLFPEGAPPSPGTAEAAADLHRAHQRTVASGARVGALAGAGVDNYLTLSSDTAGHLRADAGSDTALGAQLQRAAQLSEDGAARLDVLTARMRATVQMGATNTTPAAQRAVVAALRSQVAQARDVVATTSRQADAVASNISDLSYKHDRTRSGDPTIQMVDDKIGGDAPIPGTGSPGTPPQQVGPFLVPPEVARAAQSLPPGPGLDPRDPLYPVLHSPQPPAPLSPDEVRRLVSDEVQRQLDEKERFSAGTLINKTAEGCVIGGATAGLITLIFPPSDAVSIPAGCITGAFGNAGSYIWEQTTK